jgi:translation initiation factor IF-2
MGAWQADHLRRANARSRPRVMTAANAPARNARPGAAAPLLRRPGGTNVSRRATVSGPLRSPARAKSRPQPPARAPNERAAHKRVVKVEGAIGVAALAAAMGVKSHEVLRQLIALGAHGIHLNSTLDSDTAALVATALGWSVENTAVSDAELVRRARPSVAAAERVRRLPVVTVLGHVDHGKTTLLDHIRRTQVAAGEAGGITQRIGAYVADTPRGRITFIDTPGHSAFSAERARGASATDIVVLVVAADDGVMPQTREALELAQKAKLPVVVAINKLDKPGADAARVRQQLAGFGLVPEEWGGETLVAELSALTGQGVPELLDKLLLQAELLELTASPAQPASGFVLEAELDRGRGPLATLLVRDGTLRPRDFLVAGPAWGKVRALFDENGRALDEAGPGVPVRVFGLSEFPHAGDLAEVVQSSEAARAIGERRAREERQRALGAQSAKASLLDVARLASTPAPELRLLLKADTQGSLDAISTLLVGLEESPAKLRVVHAGVGALTESDVSLAQAGSARIFAFNVGSVGRAAVLAQRSQVNIAHYDVIYELANAIEAAQAALLRPELVEHALGEAAVLQVFRAGTTHAAGARVTQGLVRRGARVKVLRGEAELWQGQIASLRRVKEDVREVKDGLEFGIVLNGFEQFEPGDRLLVSELAAAA